MLKEIRKEKNLSQKELAEQSNVNLRMIQHYEQGFKDINKAGLNTLLNLSISLECKISDLITDIKIKEKCKRAIL